MPTLHSSLTGTDLHYPRGDIRAGALILLNDVNQAYRILDSDSEPVFEVNLAGDSKTVIGSTDYLLSKHRYLNLNYAPAASPDDVPTGDRGLVFVDENTSGSTDCRVFYWDDSDNVFRFRQISTAATLGNDDDDLSAETGGHLSLVGAAIGLVQRTATTLGGQEHIYNNVSDGELYYYDGSSHVQITDSGSVAGGGGGGGGVTTPGSTTDNGIVRWDGALGAAIQDSGMTLTDDDLTLTLNSGADTTDADPKIVLSGGDGTEQVDITIGTDTSADEVGVWRQDSGGNFEDMTFSIGNPSQTTGTTLFYLYSGSGASTRNALMYVDAGGVFRLTATAQIQLDTATYADAGFVVRSAGTYGAVGYYAAGASDWYSGVRNAAPTSFQINYGVPSGGPTWQITSESSTYQRPASTTNAVRLTDFSGVSTTSTSATSLNEISFSAGEAIAAKVMVIGETDDGTMVYHLNFGAQHDSGGTVTVLGQTLDAYEGGSVTGATVTAVAVATGVEIQVTAASSDATTWKGHVEWLVHESISV